MPIFGVKSSFLKLGILAVQKRELIIEEVHQIRLSTSVRNFLLISYTESQKYNFDNRIYIIWIFKEFYNNICILAL